MPSRKFWILVPLRLILMQFGPIREIKYIQFFPLLLLHREWQLAKYYLLTVKPYLCVNAILVSFAGMTPQRQQI